MLIKSFNGLGDLLFATPSLRVIKKTYPSCQIIFNTNYPALLQHNPFVNDIGSVDEGVFLGYDDPIHTKHPETHHIIKDWEIICGAYNLETPVPCLRPEIYFGEGWRQPERKNVGVQIQHADYWFSKKVWPHFQELCNLYPFISDNELQPIPTFPNVMELVRHIASLKLVVCAEGGISHIARAVDTPAVVLYGGFARPEWNGYEEHTNLCNYPSCGPCYNPRRCEGDFDRACFHKLSPSFVADKITELLGE